MMKLKYTRFKVFVTACSFLLLANCTKKFSEINTDPNKATRDELNFDNYYVGGFIIQMQKNVLPVANQPLYGDEIYQIVQNLAGDVFSGHQGASNNWFGGSNNTTYNLIPSWYGAAFEKAYLGIMAPWNFIQTNVKAEAPDVYAIAQIMKVLGMHRITDMYGPLPYLNAGSSGLSTTYNTQEEIYRSFFKELDSARASLKDFVQKNPSSKPLAKYDAIYKGDYKKWIKLANSLKLRLAMRIVYANSSLAKSNAEDAVSDSYGTLLTNDDNAVFSSYESIQIHNPLQIITDNFNDTRMGAPMESYLTGYQDPRLEAYFKPSDLDNKYRGIRTGISIGDRSQYVKFSKLNVSASDGLLWMSASEVFFLKAEAALRGWNMNGTPEALYNNAVSLSFLQAGVGDASRYLSDQTSVPLPYTDPVNASNSFLTGVSDLTIKWIESDLFERKLERIITQKWIALFPDGQEAWSEFRRTGYPKLFPVVVNDSRGTISSSTQIRRLPFPQSEYLNNSAGVQSGVSLLGGPDNGGTKLWWDKK